MPPTVRAELARVAESCREALKDLAELEADSSKDFKDIDQLIRQFEGEQGNLPATAEDARALSLLVRKTIDGNKLSVQLTRILMLLLLEISVLLQQGPDCVVEPPADPASPLGEWFAEWEAARNALDEYAQSEG